MTYRVYYNRTEDFPQCWSVDEGNQATEFNVCGIVIKGVTIMTQVAPPDTQVRGKAPRAWFLVKNATMRVEGGIAYFTPSK